MEDLEIIINKIIIIYVSNSFHFFFVQFLDILSHKASKKEKLSTFKNLAKFLKDKKLQIKNQDNAITNYATRFIIKTCLSSNFTNFKNFNTGQLTICRIVIKSRSQISVSIYK